MNENVTGVFIGKDFLTVTKNEGVDWESLKPSILSIILDFFSEGNEVESKTNEDNKTEESINYSEKDQEIVNKIMELLNERIKPAVAQDGGDMFC